MKEKETRVIRYHTPKQKRKINGKYVTSIVGTSLVLLPVAGSAFPTISEATEVDQQGAVSQEAFIESIGYSAASVASANDLYASVMIAQALLESGYGTSGLASAPNYNLFGVKGSYNGQTVYMPTSEYLNGQWVTMTEPFRSYASYADSFQDHANVLSTYYSGVQKSTTSSYADATAALTGRYATDPNYAYKLNSLIQTYNLTAYDWGASGTAMSTTAYSQTSASVGQSSNSYVAASTSGYASYTVAAGDTLWDIASKYGLSVEQLMSLNGLSADLITVGQVLQVA